jgi:hypothetical protein
MLSAITYHETHGTPPRLFHVTFSLAGERSVDVTCDGVSVQFRFSGRGYRPTRTADRLQLIERFLDRVDQQRPIEQANAELLHPATMRRRAAACACGDDRQLPPGDRT